jgi:O-antigen/teichoic acid export membrane protein
LAVQWLYQDDPELATTFLIGIVAAPFIALRLVGAAAVRAFGGIITSMVPERIVRDSIALAFLGAAVLGGLIAPDAATAMWAMLASAIVTLGLVRYFLRRARPAEVGIGLRVYAARDWIRPTLPLTVIMAADIVMSRSGVLVLGLQGDTLGAGIFFVAFSVAQITALPRMAVASVFAPMVSDRYSRGDATGLQALSAKAACVSLLGTAVVALPFLLYPAALLSWFGPEFVAGAPVVVILLVGQLLAAAAGPQQHLLTMTGHERAGATFMASSAVANFLGALLLVGPFGMTGAAVAVSGSVVVWNVAMALFLRRRLGLRPGLAVALIRRSSVGATIHEGDPDLGTAPPRPDQV